MVALKVAVMLVESQKKTAWLTWSDTGEHSVEEESGIFGLGVFYWLHRLFINGHRTSLSTETVFPLDQTISAPVLAPELARRLRMSSWRGRGWGLTKVLFSTLAPPLRSEKSHGRSLIGATILSYGLLALSTVLYGYFQERFVIMVRGCLIAAMYDQTVQLELASSTDPGLLTLMSTDVSRLMAGLLDIHEYRGSSIQVGLSSRRLQKKLGEAFVAPLVVAVLTFLAMFFLSRVIDRRQRAWMEAIGIRMPPIKKRIQQLRVAEVGVGERRRMLAVAGAAISQVPLLISPVLASATTIKVPQLLSAFTSLRRVQEFLERGARNDYRISHSDSRFAGMGIETHNDVDTNVFGGSRTRDSDVGISIPASCVAAAIGPVGSGKTTVCGYILGELPSARGFANLSTNSFPL
ncbi:ABC transporter transmembrane region [Geosmithia morbida]|uniref:ABC transporter transmembrane region n=1 Tax=Geosmithia morbida TaxID=1094350 RepID=A0A9P5D3M9_9HYPO|nr:ABC transporter transmembrane region [Geosmithia morbida]KAF4121955.1 ABC transporter transmembrane region [Geosmithia morbida]